MAMRISKIYWVFRSLARILRQRNAKASLKILGTTKPSLGKFYKRKSQEKHFSARRIGSAFPALLNEREWFWSSAPWTRFGAQLRTAVWIFSPRGFHRMFATTPVCSETPPANGGPMVAECEYRRLGSPTRPYPAPLAPAPAKPIKRAVQRVHLLGFTVSQALNN